MSRFSALIISLLFISCSTLKIKENIKESEVKTFAGIDSTKTKLSAAGSLTTINEKKDYTITKGNTIVKIDSFYFAVPYKTIVYSEGKNTVIHDTVTIKEEAKGVSIDSTSAKKKETTTKEKKTNSNYLYYLFFMAAAGFYAYHLFIKKNNNK